MDQIKLTRRNAIQRKPSALRKRFSSPFFRAKTVAFKTYDKETSVLTPLLDVADQPNVSHASSVDPNASVTVRDVTSTLTSTPNRTTQSRFALLPPVSPICDRLRKKSHRHVTSPMRQREAKLGPKLLAFCPTKGDDDDDELMRTIVDMSCHEERLDQSGMDILFDTKLGPDMDIDEASLINTDVSMADFSHMDLQ